MSDTKSFIEVQFPVSKISKESYKERKSSQGQTITGLGKWWGRKPLILVRSAIIGTLMPASDNPSKDTDIFLKILSMDKRGLEMRKEKRISNSELAAIIMSNPRLKSRYASWINQEGDKIQIDKEAPREEMEIDAFNCLGYDEKIALCMRPEQLENLDDTVWDEINDYSVSLFVNYRITDEEGNLLGVVGCGSHIDDFQKQLAAYEEEDKLRIYITNIGNAHNSYSGNTQNYRQLHDLEKDLGVTREEILKDEGMSYVQKDQLEYVVLTHHIDELNWDVVVVKETATLLDAFLSRLNATIFNTFVFVGLFAGGISFALTRINERQIEQENMDELTGLANRRLFERKLRGILRKHNKKGCRMSFFILDIDDFKQFNDEFGHLYGNSVLQLVGQTLKGLCRDVGLPARWGGDEFTGILFLPEEEAKVALEKIDGILRQEEMQMPVHVSVGITEIRQQDTKEEMMRRADSALYTSKKRGKAQCTIYREE